MRVCTAFNRLLGLPGASVIDVAFGDEGVIVTVRLRRRRRVCAGCGQTGRRLQIHDRRIKRWRHLDLGASRCIIECELRRLALPGLPDRPPGAGAVGAARRPVHARLRGRRRLAGAADGQDADRRAAADRVGLGRAIVERVMADRLDEARLDGLIAIGVDEISYRRRQRYLTSVADHGPGRSCGAPGRNSATLQAFFDELGDRKHSIRAVSIDMTGEYQRARAAVPDAQKPPRSLSRLPPR